jgi:hypothetical protein
MIHFSNSVEKEKVQLTKRREFIYFVHTVQRLKKTALFTLKATTAPLKPLRIGNLLSYLDNRILN